MTFFRCRRCLYPNTKPDIWFDKSGLCSACIAFDKRKEIDWDKRREEFRILCNDRKPRGIYDCIVACSGGKDSTAQVVKCLELGLRPLAVTATTDHLSEIGRRNLDNIGKLCDHTEVTPNKDIRKRIAKFALMEVGDISWCEHHLIWSIPAIEAVKRGIPIVLYGECPQNEYGAGPAGTESAERLSEPWVHEFGGHLGLRLGDVRDLLGIADDALPEYHRPSDEHVKCHWMGAYFEWDGYKNYLTAREHGFAQYHTDVEGSLFGYENLDNLQTGLHDRLRFLKFGYSRAVDIASNHIRRGYMTRKHGAEMVRWRESEWPETYLGAAYEDILAAIDVTMDEWRRVCERFINVPVVQWASKPGSFQSFSTTRKAASKDGSSVTIAA